MLSCADVLERAARDALNLKLPRLHPITWAEDILSECSFTDMDREMTISIMANIWDSRNKWSHDDQGFEPKATVEYISETLGLLHGLREKKGKSKRLISTWTRPPEGVVKVNSDGAVRLSEGLAASGGVARDGDGFRSAWCRVYQGITEPLTIEALTVRDAVAAARAQNFERIIAETDSSELVGL
uniref:Uncharacterized protein n=1 Tax=Avena sativa TaxID=4498 RepID=A0ACD5Y1Z1_AVESA